MAEGSSVWSYKNKRVVIVGCYSGMGEACARELVDLGAEVHGFDVRESPVNLASFTKVDLGNPLSIDAAAASLPGQIDSLFNCAGLPQTFGPAAVMKVNFIGMRHWTERWLPKIRPGGAVATIASTAAYRYMDDQGPALELVATPDFAAAVDWVEAHPDIVGDGYGFSKKAIILYTLRRSTETVKQGVRMNVTLPSPTETPMWKEHFAKFVTPARFEAFAGPMGRFSTSAEQAYPLIFLNSDAASMVNGLAMPVDGGFVGGVFSGAYDPMKIMAAAGA
jgi:NAD(P)-dependent dehydrogenase (short-subunit alcohol dehydrogenase family)